MTETVSLTYCGNVHPATDVDQWRSTTERFAVPLAARQRAAGLPFGLGTWWNAATAAALVGDPAQLAELRAFLAAADLSVWTANVFPYGDFHGRPVKAGVYRPDWSAAERVRYTLDVARVVAQLGSDRAEVPLSTLPVAFEPGDLAPHAANLLRVADQLHRLAEESGVRVVLALEPEPFCRLETVAATARFLEEQVFATGDAAAADRARRHLGVCVDLCHLAVVGEDPLAALADLRRRGIACPKIQVSAGLELRDPAALDQLLAFDEPVYLHQTVAAGGARALDLPEVGQRRREFTAAGVLRTHFHMPVFWDQDGPLGSTRRQLQRVLAALPRPLPLLEVETYTWGVLPGWDHSDAALLAGLARELEFVRELVVGSWETP